MRVTINHRDAIAIAAVDSSILQENVPMLRSRLNQLLEENQKWIVIDLSQANYLSSMGVAVIVDIKLKANKVNGDVKLAGVNRLVRSLLDITNVTKRMDIYGSVDEAMEAIKKMMNKQARKS